MTKENITPDPTIVAVESPQRKTKSKSPYGQNKQVGYDNTGAPVQSYDYKKTATMTVSARIQERTKKKASDYYI